MFLVLMFGVPKEQNASTIRLARYIAISQVSSFLFLWENFSSVTNYIFRKSRTDRKLLTWLIPIYLASLIVEAFCSFGTPNSRTRNRCSLVTTTVQSRVLTRVTIQKIKSLGVLQFEFYVVKWGATNRDMSLTETCQCSRLYGILF